MCVIAIMHARSDIQAQVHCSKIVGYGSIWFVFGSWLALEGYKLTYSKMDNSPITLLKLACLFTTEVHSPSGQQHWCMSLDALHALLLRHRKLYTYACPNVHLHHGYAAIKGQDAYDALHCT